MSSKKEVQVWDTVGQAVLDTAEGCGKAERPQPQMTSASPWLWLLSLQSGPTRRCLQLIQEELMTSLLHHSPAPGIAHPHITLPQEEP